MTSLAGTYGSEAQDVLVNITVNDIWPYAENIFFEMSDEVRTWVRNIRLTSEGLAFSLSENKTGRMRVGKINIRYVADSGETANGTFMITQK